MQLFWRHVYFHGGLLLTVWSRFFSRNTFLVLCK